MNLLLVTVMIAVITATAWAITPWYASCGAHTVILKPDGTVWTMGRNDFGQLGNGSPVDYGAEPARVTLFDDVKAVAAGLAHSVVLRKDGTVWTWGFNGTGQLGDRTRENRDMPVQVSGLGNVIAIASGHSHVLALQGDGTVWGWGSNSWGQLGGAAGEATAVPVKVAGINNIVAVSAGALHTTLLKSNGTVWSLGYNSLGQLGDGSTLESSLPRKVVDLDQVVAISGGNHHTVALRRNGTLWAWGCNNYGQLGNGKNCEKSLRPMQINGIGKVADLTAKSNHTYAMLRDGTVWGWGDKGPELWSNRHVKQGSDVPHPLRGTSKSLTVAAIGNPITLLDNETTNRADLDLSADLSAENPGAATMASLVRPGVDSASVYARLE